MNPTPVNFITGLHTEVPQFKSAALSSSPAQRVWKLAARQTGKPASRLRRHPRAGFAAALLLALLADLRAAVRAILPSKSIVRPLSLLLLPTVLLVGHVAISDVLDNWTYRNPGISRDFSSLDFGKGTYVVVGQQSTILTSPDGTTWTNRNSGTTTGTGDVAYGNGTFVIVGLGGTILTSEDGITWTPRASGTSANFGGVHFLNSQFITVGDRATIATSPKKTDFMLCS